MQSSKIKIDIVGNGCSWVKELSASYILDEKLMIDAPEGSFKMLYNKYDLTKIKNIAITHLHNDHFLSLHMILQVMKDFCPNEKINILAPQKCKEKLYKLFEALNEEYLKKYVESNVNFLICEDKKIFKLGNFEVECFEVKHADIEAYGFIIRKGNISVGFSGDCIKCKGLLNILENVKTIFIDCTNITPDEKHLSCSEVIELKKEYPKTIFYPIHFSKLSFKEMKGKMKILKEGSKVFIK